MGCLLFFMSRTPDDLTRLFASELRFMMLPSPEPALARRPAPQKASGNESLPGAILPYWLDHAFDEPRFRGLRGNFPEPKDSRRRYPRHAVQTHLPDSRVRTSHRPAAGRHRSPHLRGNRSEE